MNFWMLIIALPAASLSVGLTALILKGVVSSFKNDTKK